MFPFLRLACRPSNLRTDLFNPPLHRFCSKYPHQTTEFRGPGESVENPAGAFPRDTRQRTFPTPRFRIHGPTTFFFFFPTNLTFPLLLPLLQLTRTRSRPTAPRARSSERSKTHTPSKKHSPSSKPASTRSSAFSRPRRTRWRKRATSQRANRGEFANIFPSLKAQCCG